MQAFKTMAEELRKQREEAKQQVAEAQ